MSNEDVPTADEPEPAAVEQAGSADAGPPSENDAEAPQGLNEPDYDSRESALSPERKMQGPPLDFDDDANESVLTDDRDDEQPVDPA